jgi:hypothetical protein
MKQGYISGLFCLFTLGCLGQSTEGSFAEKLAKLEAELDSMSIFRLLDSALNPQQQKSELLVRMGYMSSVLTAGRDFNVQQRGIAPGVSYYHKSGVFGDFATYFDSQSQPLANLSVLTGGYIGLMGKRWTYSGYYEHVLNHQSTPRPLSNGIGGSLAYEWKSVQLLTDYAFLWGTETGHRLMPSLGYRWRLGDFGIFKSVKVYPGITLLAGTTSLFNYRFSESQVDNYLLDVQSLTNQQISWLVRNGKITTEEAIRLRALVKELNDLSPEDRQLLLNSMRELVQEKAFHLLSYSLNLPVTARLGDRTGIILGYTLAIPQKLPGEGTNLNPIGFFSFSLNYKLSIGQ